MVGRLRIRAGLLAVATRLRAGAGPPLLTAADGDEIDREIRDARGEVAANDKPNFDDWKNSLTRQPLVAGWAR